MTVYDDPYQLRAFVHNINVGNRVLGFLKIGE